MICIPKVVQKVGQPVKDYIDIVKRQAARCKIGTFATEACKDQLILDVLDTSLWKRYLQEDDLTFEKTYSLALQFEAIESQSRMLSHVMRIIAMGKSSVMAVRNQ